MDIERLNRATHVHRLIKRALWATFLISLVLLLLLTVLTEPGHLRDPEKNPVGFVAQWFLFWSGLIALALALIWTVGHTIVRRRMRKAAEQSIRETFT